MKRFLKTLVAAGMLAAATQAFAVAPTLIGTYTVDVTKIKDSIAFSGCSKIVTVPPDSVTVDFYDDYTFTETITVTGTPNYWYGTWGQVDGAKWSKLRFTFTGSAGDGTGTWATYVSNIAAVAGVACANTTVQAFGATLRVLKSDLSIRTTGPRLGSGTASSSFQTEIYGYDVDFALYGKGTERRTDSGTFTWY